MYFVHNKYHLKEIVIIRFPSIQQHSTVNIHELYIPFVMHSAFITRSLWMDEKASETSSEF